MDELDFGFPESPGGRHSGGPTLRTNPPHVPCRSRPGPASPKESTQRTRGRNGRKGRENLGTVRIMGSIRITFSKIFLAALRCAAKCPVQRWRCEGRGDQSSLTPRSGRERQSVSEGSSAAKGAHRAALRLGACSPRFIPATEVALGWERGVRAAPRLEPKWPQPFWLDG